jgi:fluoride ion exporter CrcB/FEX
MRPTITLKPRQMALALALVAVGGALGTWARDVALRLQVGSATPARGSASLTGPVSWTSHIPWVLLAINFVGVYVAVVALRGPLKHHDPNDLTRLFVITGLLGGFTSYSSLYVSLAQIWHLSVVASVGVAGGAVASGLVGAWLGMRTLR